MKRSLKKGLPGGPNEKVFSKEGYRSTSPDVNNLFNFIPSGNITMKEKDGTPLKKGPLLGIDNLGNSKLMLPGANYQFPGDVVKEVPLAKKGGLPKAQKGLSYNQRMQAYNDSLALYNSYNQFMNVLKNPQYKLPSAAISKYQGRNQGWGPMKLPGNPYQNISPIKVFTHYQGNQPWRVFKYKKPIMPQNQPNNFLTKTKPKSVTSPCSNPITTVINNVPEKAPSGKKLVGTNSETLPVIGKKCEYVETINPIYEDIKIEPIELPIIDPPLLENKDLGELQVHDYTLSDSIEAPQYTLDPYTADRLRLSVTPGKSRRVTKSGRLSGGQRYKHTEYKPTKDLEFGKKEVTKPIAALVQKLTGYDPKYFEGYEDEEGNFVPGELDYGNATGSEMEFRGAASLRDFINQQKYKKEYEEYDKNLDTWLEQYEQSKKKQAEGQAFKKGGPFQNSNIYATNKLFAKNPLFKKRKKGKKAKGIYNPKAKYTYQGGGAIEIEIDESDIDKYVKGGYVVEDISVPSLTRMDEGGEKRKKRKSKEKNVEVIDSTEQPITPENIEQVIEKPEVEVNPAQERVPLMMQFSNEFQENNPYDAYYEKAAYDYLKSKKGWNEALGINKSNLPENVAKRIQNNYYKDLEKYVIGKSKSIQKDYMGKFDKKGNWKPLMGKINTLNPLSKRPTGHGSWDNYGDGSIQLVYPEQLFMGPGAGILGLAGRAAAKGISNLAKSSLIQGTKAALSQPIANIPGVTIGNAIASGFAADAVVNRFPKVPSQIAEGNYLGALENTLTGALDVAGANMMSPLLKGIGKGVKALPGAIRASKESGLLSNTYKLNPFAGKLGEYNRIVGQDAILDLQNSGLVRAGEYGGVESNFGSFDGVRTTPYPSFGKGAPRQAYIDQTIQQGKIPYVISTDRPMGVSTLGRHGKGSTMFPIDETGKYMSAFPADEVRVFGAYPHWLKGYKEVPVELPGSPNTSISDKLKQFFDRPPGPLMIGLGSGTKSTREVPLFKSEIDWVDWVKKHNKNYDAEDIQNIIKNSEEYNIIEQQTKANGTWMKNADGTPFQGTPEQFIQQQSTKFKQAYPEGTEITYRGGDKRDALKSDWSSKSNVVFTTKDEYGARTYNRSLDQPPLVLTEAPPEGISQLYMPKTSNKIVIDGNEYPVGHKYRSHGFPYINDAGKEVYSPGSRTNYARLNAIDQVPANELEAKNLEAFKTWMLENRPTMTERGWSGEPRILNDWVMTDHFAAFLNSPAARDIDRVEFQKIMDGTIEPIDVEVHNLNKAQQLKSMFGNSGEFDLTNPNKFKALLPYLIPTGLGVGAASQMQGQESNEGYKQGGIVSNLTKKEIDKLIKQGYIIEEID